MSFIPLFVNVILEPVSPERLFLNKFINEFSNLKDGIESSKGKNLRSCANLDIWVFENFIQVDKQFEKALQSLKTCVSVDNNFCGKLV